MQRPDVHTNVSTSEHAHEHHQLMMKSAAQPSLSILAASDEQIDYATDSLCNHSISAQSKDNTHVHNTSASISGCLL